MKALALPVAPLAPVGAARPPCSDEDPALFDSTDPADHVRARRHCVTCPMANACLSRALEIAGPEPSNYRERGERGPDGTWAGLLWRNGSIVHRSEWLKAAARARAAAAREAALVDGD